MAGALFAIGSSATSPMHMTIVMDRADPRTRGSSMATYSLGFQLGSGFGAAISGFIIGAFGFPAPFVVALVAMAVMAALVLSARRAATSTAVGRDGVTGAGYRTRESGCSLASRRNRCSSATTRR